MGWFKNWFGTPWYALLYGNRDEFEAKAWVDAILEHWQLMPGARVLDLACGRGRHARWLAEAGMRITGVDISEESIRNARELVPHGEFHVHDMREPIAQEHFDGVCCLFTSLGYFDTVADDRKVFSAALQALRPGGRFVLDFMNSAKVITHLVAEEELVRGEVQFHITRSLEEGAIVKRITVNEEGRTHHFEEKVQALMPDQLEAMAVETGFEIEARTDGPDTSLFDPVLSDRFVLWMKKPMS